jgi:PadR family transcriptional regulator PadR
MTPSTTAASTIFENLRLELRRGCLTIAVLSQLRVERYGYTLRKALEAAGLDIDEGTLYPLLRRLESQGLLQSRWGEENKRRKRFYKLLPAGEGVYEQLTAEMARINASLDRIVSEA